MQSSSERTAFGDFQTPPDLASDICRLLSECHPTTVVEPTCGTGTFLAAALRQFPSAGSAFGLDVNPRYVAAAREHIATVCSGADCKVRTANFFQTDWDALLAQCAEPILVIGNPPWVTNSTLGVLGSDNHPRKVNRCRLGGLDALTGKSNFDVSEWMIVRLMEAVGRRRATLALLCKTSVARKVLRHAWNTGAAIESAEIRRIDAERYFASRVDACLLTCRIGARPSPSECRVFARLDSREPQQTFGLRDGRLVADVGSYERVRHLSGGGHRWRSGVKHDCSAVFELEHDGRTLTNGMGERVDVEPRCLFPLLKSSHLANAEAVRAGHRRILLSQLRVGQETEPLAQTAPKTWRYLLAHADRLDRRASSVYRNKPRFSMFGIGPYTFSPWKVAVSGFYKNPRFRAVGPVGRRPVVVDDTCYILPCVSEAAAQRRAAALNSRQGREFFSAFIFPDAKRPLTADVLGLLDLDRLEAEIGLAIEQRLRLPQGIEGR